MLRWDFYIILIFGYDKVRFFLFFCAEITLSLGAAAFITAAGQHLPPSDIWCILYPSLRHFMKSDIFTIDEHSLLTALKPPVHFPPYLSFRYFDLFI